MKYRTVDDQAPANFVRQALRTTVLVFLIHAAAKNTCVRVKNFEKRKKAQSADAVFISKQRSNGLHNNYSFYHCSASRYLLDNPRIEKDPSTKNRACEVW